MTGQDAEEKPATYDRQLLLYGTKRNAVLALWEVKRYGADSFHDEDYVSIYAMRPDEWYAKGIRLLGRTAVECTRDALGNAIGKEIAITAATFLLVRPIPWFGFSTTCQAPGAWRSSLMPGFSS